MTETKAILQKYGYSVEINKDLIKVEKKGSGCLLAYFIGLAAFIIYYIIDSSANFTMSGREDYAFLGVLWAILFILLVFIHIKESIQYFEITNSTIKFHIDKWKGEWDISEVCNIQREEERKEKFWGYRSYTQKLLINHKNGYAINLLSFMSSEDDPIEEMNNVKCFFESYLQKYQRDQMVKTLKIAYSRSRTGNHSVQY